MLPHRCHHIGIMVIVTSMLPYWYNDYGPHRQCCLWQTQITGTHQWPLDRHGCIWQATSEVCALFMFCFVLFCCHELGEGHWEKDQEQPCPQLHPTFAIEEKWVGSSGLSCCQNLTCLVRSPWAAEVKMKLGRQMCLRERALAEAEREAECSGLLLDGPGVKRNFQEIRIIALTPWLPGFTIPL